MKTALICWRKSFWRYGHSMLANQQKLTDGTDVSTWEDIVRTFQRRWPDRIITGFHKLDET